MKWIWCQKLQSISWWHELPVLVVQVLGASATRLINKIISHHGGIQAGLDQARIWPKKRVSIMRKAASSHSANSVQAMLDLCLRIDQSSKGASHENVWDLLSMLTLRLAKQPVHS